MTDFVAPSFKLNNGFALNSDGRTVSVTFTIPNLTGDVLHLTRDIYAVMSITDPTSVDVIRTYPRFNDQLNGLFIQVMQGNLTKDDSDEAIAARKEAAEKAVQEQQKTTVETTTSTASVG